MTAPEIDRDLIMEAFITFGEEVQDPELRTLVWTVAKYVDTLEEELRKARQ